jgi:hypothetical protein
MAVTIFGGHWLGTTESSCHPSDEARSRTRSISFPRGPPRWNTPASGKPFSSSVEMRPSAFDASEPARTEYHRSDPHFSGMIPREWRLPFP